MSSVKELWQSWKQAPDTDHVEKMDDVKQQAQQALGTSMDRDAAQQLQEAFNFFIEEAKEKMDVLKFSSYKTLLDVLQALLLWLPSDEVQQAKLSRLHNLHEQQVQMNRYQALEQEEVEFTLKNAGCKDLLADLIRTEQVLGSESKASQWAADLARKAREATRKVLLQAENAMIAGAAAKVEKCESKAKLWSGGLETGEDWDAGLAQHAVWEVCLKKAQSTLLLQPKEKVQEMYAAKDQLAEAWIVTVLSWGGEM